MVFNNQLNFVKSSKSFQRVWDWNQASGASKHLNSVGDPLYCEGLSCVAVGLVVVVAAAAVAVVVGFLRAFGQCTTVATVNQLHFCNKDPSHSHVVCPRSFRSKPLPSPKRTCGERQTILVISQGCLPKAKFKQTMWTQLTACLSFYIDKAHRAATSSYKIRLWNHNCFTAPLQLLSCKSLSFQMDACAPSSAPHLPILVRASKWGSSASWTYSYMYYHIRMIFKCIYLSPPQYL